MRRGSDVEEHHFVGALLIVAEREFDRVADVTEFARLGLAESYAAGDLAGVHVETRNDPFGNHRTLFLQKETKKTKSEDKPGFLVFFVCFC